MKHLGDITKLNGASIPPVYVVTGGSPCQDLSVAGNRAGLDGTRSGLFLEMIRVIKEMRDESGNRTPRFVVFENVPGAFSSNKGEDFRRILEEFARIAEPGISIPRPAKKWKSAGTIMGDSWSITWRVLDPQYWGVPQRRKRIALVVDLGGWCSGKILFEPSRVQGDTESSNETWEGPSRASAACAGSTVAGGEIVYCLAGNTIGRKDRNGGNGLGVQEDVSYTLNTIDHHAVCAVPINGMVATRQGEEKRTCLGIGKPGDPQFTLSATHSHAVAVFDSQKKVTNQTAICLCIGNGQANQAISPVVGTLNTMHDQQAILYAESAYGQYVEGKTAAPIRAAGGNNGGGSESLVLRTVVRRLTPLECERLQGFPDGWTDIGKWVDSKGKPKATTDTSRYKALGNSLALPQWKWIASMLKPYCKENMTMGSLFDGIGGFPLAFSSEGFTPVWASEIDEFGIAVTKRRFGDN